MSVENLDGFVSDLRNTSRDVRLRSLEDLAKFISQCDEDRRMEEFIEKIYLSVLNVYADTHESCREKSILLIEEVISKLPLKPFIYESVVSTLFSRLGKPVIIETSEQTRLCGVKQLHTLIGKLNEKTWFGEVVEKIIGILSETLQDKSPAVNQESCACVSKLARLEKNLQINRLIKPLVNLLTHRHAVCRVLAIKALTALGHQLKEFEDFAVIISNVTARLMDSVSIVRLECGRLAVDWCLHLDQRYSFFRNILPLILCSLNDDSTEVQREMAEGWIQCGEQYFVENECELSNINILNATTKCSGEVTPTIGCMELVKRNVSIIRPVLLEVLDWKEDVRYFSLKLLAQILVHARESTLQYVPDLIKALSLRMQDDNVMIVKEAINVSKLLGKVFGNEQTVFEHSFSELKIGNLMCLHAFCSGLTFTSDNNKKMLLQSLLKTNYQTNFKWELQNSVLGVIENVWNNRDLDKTTESFQFLYFVLIKIIALSRQLGIHNTNTIYRRSTSLLNSFAGNPLAIRELHSLHLEKFLSLSKDISPIIEDDSEIVDLISGIISEVGIQAYYLNDIVFWTRKILKDTEPVPKFKLLGAISIALVRSETEYVQKPEESKHTIIMMWKEFLNPLFDWKPSIAAQSLKALSCSVVYALAWTMPKTATLILKEYGDKIIRCLEDENYTILLYVLKTLQLVPFLPAKEVMFAALRHLDSPHAKIRLYAAKVIVKYSQVERNNQNLINNFSDHFVKTLFMHSLNNDALVRRVLFKSFVNLGRTAPEMISSLQKYIS